MYISSVQQEFGEANPSLLHMSVPNLDLGFGTRTERSLVKSPSHGEVHFSADYPDFSLKDLTLFLVLLLTGLGVLFGAVLPLLGLVVPVLAVWPLVGADFGSVFFVSLADPESVVGVGFTGEALAFGVTT